MLTSLKGLYAPIVSPLYKGTIDTESLKKLIENIEPFVEGYVPCLSSGEGAVLSDEQWEQVVMTTVHSTTKPVIAGIKRQKKEDIVRLAGIAKKLGAQAVILPIWFNSEDENISFFEDIAQSIDLPIVIYNTETKAVKTLEGVKKLDAIKKIIAIKDSSLDIEFFKKVVAAKKNGEVRMSVLQGLEHLLLDSVGCDGFLISLANVEPKLCKEMLEHPSKDLNEKIITIFSEYNLGGDWFITLKALLYSRGIIRSAEQVNQSIAL